MDLHSRHAQLFPVLTGLQIEVAKRFASGKAKRFGPGEPVSSIGDRNVPAWLVLSGRLDVFGKIGSRAETAIVSYGAGQFSGELNQLSGRPAMAGSRAGHDGCVAIPFDATHVKALIIGSAEVGEIIMRAYILRRVALIDSGNSGTVLVGHDGSSALRALQVFLSRSGYPHVVLDASSEGEGHDLVERLGIQENDLPVLVCPNGTVLKRPTEPEVACCLGITPKLDPDTVYDTAIVGAGPSGLAAAVYAASEGLNVIVLDERTAGGQAGSSSRIENYLGFPTGISGQALAGRALNQALKFGAEVALPLKISEMSPPVPGSRRSGLINLRTTDGRSILTRTVVVASGARYRRPGISNVSDFEGAGVSYWASPIEAKWCENRDIVVVGGGNSAGQAIAYLAPKVSNLHLVIRRDLAETMSTYLIERIAALPNVTMHIGCEVGSVSGDPSLLSVKIRNLRSGTETDLDVRQVFMFIGADPNTSWLCPHISTDRSGFIVTGLTFDPFIKQELGRGSLPLETSVPNIFAIGDVRAGSTKRVAAAVGEGAAVVSQIHTALGHLEGRLTSSPANTAPTAQIQSH